LTNNIATELKVIKSLHEKAALPDYFFDFSHLKGEFLIENRGVDGVVALTAAELDVAAGLWLGLSFKKIASLRGSSARTVEAQCTSIRRKLLVPKLSPLVLFIVVFKNKHLF